jgi:hypothetical protein
VDISKRHGGEIPYTDLSSPAADLLKNEQITRSLKDQLNQFKQDAMNLKLDMKQNRFTGVGHFANPALAKAIAEGADKENVGKLIARISIPRPDAVVGKSQVVPVRVGYSDWKKIHQLLEP